MSEDPPRPTVRRGSRVGVTMPAPDSSPSSPKVDRPRRSIAALEILLEEVVAKQAASERILIDLARTAPTQETLHFVFKQTQQVAQSLRDHATETRAQLAQVIAMVQRLMEQNGASMLPPAPPPEIPPPPPTSRFPVDG